MILHLSVYPKLACGAMCMEVSSVFLSMCLARLDNPRYMELNMRHLMFRQIDGSLCALLSDVAAAFFEP